MILKKKRTKSLRLAIKNGSTDKQAGSNSLSITIPSNDWRIPNQSLNFTIREAQVIRRFLNENLED